MCNIKADIIRVSIGGLYIDMNCVEHFSVNPRNTYFYRKHDGGRMVEVETERLSVEFKQRFNIPVKAESINVNE